MLKASAHSAATQGGKRLCTVELKQCAAINSTLKPSLLQQVAQQLAGCGGEATGGGPS